jgi:hypothetical protein
VVTQGGIPPSLVLGHSKPDTALIYAEPDQDRARALMRQVG